MDGGDEGTPGTARGTHLQELREALNTAKTLREKQESLLNTASAIAQTPTLVGGTPITGAARGSPEPWFQAMKTALLELPDTTNFRSGAEFDLKYEASLLPMLHGTAACMPQGLTRSMEEEFLINEGGKFYTVFKYVVYQVAEEREDSVSSQGLSEGPRLKKLRDKGRAGWKLADFANLPGARQAGLTQAEVACVRLYTSFERVSWLLNQALRSWSKDQIQPWATTICILISAIIKLSQLSSPDTVVYSGMPPCTFKALESFSGNSGKETYVQYGFLPSTRDPKQNASYVGGKFTETVVWVIESTFSSRPADVSIISMYPEEEEMLFPPCTALQILAIERIDDLNKTLVLVRPHICTMRLYTDGLLYPWSSPNDALTPEEYEEVVAAERAHADTDEGALNGKFASNVKELLTGEPKAAALGLEDYMDFNYKQRIDEFGSIRAAIEAEFHDKKDQVCDDGKTLWYWFDYVAYQAASPAKVRWGDRDTNHDGMRLEDFLAMPQAQKAHLKIEHILVLRLYTATPVSFELNTPLRRFKVDEATGLVLKPIRMCEAHPFPVTVTVLNKTMNACIHISRCIHLYVYMQMICLCIRRC